MRGGNGRLRDARSARGPEFGFASSSDNAPSTSRCFSLCRRDITLRSWPVHSSFRRSKTAPCDCTLCTETARCISPASWSCAFRIVRWWSSFTLYGDSGRPSRDPGVSWSSRFSRSDWFHAPGSRNALSKPISPMRALGNDWSRVLVSDISVDSGLGVGSWLRKSGSSAGEGARTAM